jgi:hypothetical protein
MIANKRNRRETTPAVVAFKTICLLKDRVAGSDVVFSYFPVTIL